MNLRYRLVLINKILITIIVTLAFLLISCEEKAPRATAPREEISTELQPDQISWNVKIEFVDSNYTKAILYAKKASVYQERMETFLDSGLVVDFFSQTSGQRLSNLVADKARIDDRTKNMIAEGNVVVISESTNRKLETPLLSWDNATQKFYSSEFVKITTSDEVIQGYGFESDANLNNYKILKVSGVKQ